jgi:ribokinase
VPSFDVCVVGSANLDLVARTPRHPAPGETVLGDDYAEHPGGKGLNQAVACARSGASTAFVGSVGRDPAGSRLEQVLVDDGIDISGLRFSEAPTGRALIVVDRHGENSIVVVPGANATLADVTISDCSVLLGQLEVPMSVVAAAFGSARAAGTTTILNPAPATSLSSELIRACDIVIPNEHELSILGGAEQLLAAGCAAVVVTRGGAGVDVVTGTGSAHVAPFTVDVVDTTGAGDAFCGALAARLAHGDELLVAARWAAAAGALATTRPGAVPAQPHADAISALLAG